MRPGRHGDGGGHTSHISYGKSHFLALFFNLRKISPKIFKRNP